MKESFETNGNGTRYTLNLNVPYNSAGSSGNTSPGDAYPALSGGGNADGGFYDGSSDYAMRTDVTALGSSFAHSPTGMDSTYFFAFEDTDDNGTGISDFVFNMQFDDINISNYDSLKLSFLVATPRAANFDNGVGTLNNWDSVAIFYRVDANTNWTKLAYFTGNDFSDGANGALEEDTDFDYVTDGNQIGTGTNCVFQNIVKNIGATGNTIDILVVVDVNGGSEELALDNFVLTGVSTGSSPVTVSITSQTNVSCNGQSFGALTATAADGTTPITYQWSTGASSATISSLLAGTYTVTVTDNGGTTATTSATITQPAAALVASASVTSAIACNSNTNGQVTASGSGGITPYTYSWNTGGTSALETNLAAGTYSVTITDQNGCTDSTSVSLTQPVFLNSSAAVTQILDCFNDTDGRVTASANGGTMPYTYSWNTGGTAALETSLAAGTYSVTVTDQNGCTDSTTITLTQPSILVASASETQAISAPSNSDGQTTASASGGTAPYTYSWNTGGTAALETGLAAGTYSVTLTDQNGCTDSTSTTLVDPLPLNASAVVTQILDCNGDSDGRLTASATGGATPYTYSWNTGGTAALETGLSVGTYSVTITDQNGSTDSTSISLTQPVLLNASASVTQNVTTLGGSDGSLTASAAGGTSPYTYSWNTGGTAALETGLAAGTYSVTLTDQNGCTDSTSISLAPGAAPLYTIFNPKIVNTFPYTDTNATSAGGSTATGMQGSCSSLPCCSTNVYKVTIPSDGALRVELTNFSPLAGTMIAYRSLVANPTSFSNLEYISSTPGNFCGFRDTLSLGRYYDFGSVAYGAAPNVVPGAPTAVYNFSSPSTQTGFFPAGDYYILVFNENQQGNLGVGTTSDVTFEFAAAAGGSITSQTNISCNGQSNGALTATAIGTANFTYQWSNGSTTSNTASTTNSITNLAAGTYTVTVTDSNGVTGTASGTITQPVALGSSTAVTSALDCNSNTDGQITASGSGGTSPYTYSWNTGGTAALETGLGAGTYSVTITDQNGCTDSTSISLTQPATLVATATLDSNATNVAGNNGGASAAATGGTMPYTYSWSNSATTAAITGVGAGTYSVTITDQNGCTDSSSVSVVAGPSPTVSVGSNISCNGLSDGSASAAVAGGTMPYTYAWSNSATTASITNVAAGTYTVTVTDANGITGTSSATVTEPALLAASSTINSNVSCNGFSDGGATASATGGTMPYTYLWSNSATSTAISGVVAGTYTATITDANGCTNSTSATITEPTILSATANLDSNATNVAGNNGGASASVTGGTSPYTYIWSNGATTSAITGLGAGTYNTTVTDANGCTDSNAVTVVAGPAPTVSIGSNISCNGLSDGSASAAVAGGTSPYTYAWSNSATTASITGVAAGTYTVTVTDANGITGTSSGTITEPTLLGASATVTQTLDCNGDTDGQITASGSGGTSPYTYSWNTGGTSALETSLGAGTYSVTITDQNGCTDSTSISLTQPVTLVATATLDSNATNVAGNNGGVSASATGGTTAYTYAWSNGATTAAITGLGAGTYTVTITDANGCTDSNAITVVAGPVITLNLDSNLNCNGDLSGGTSASVIGGVMPYTYAWSNSATTSAITGVPAGTYTLTVTDGNGLTDVSSMVISEPATLISAALVDSNITCNGFSNGGATVSATGGTTAYTYTWSNSATTASITGVVAGTYSVTITDANGCTDFSAVNITEPAALGVALTIDSIDRGNTDGGLTAASSGGTMPYTYLWSNSATTASITGLAAGVYTVTVSDANGCTISDLDTIVTLPTVTVTNDSNVTCNLFSNGGASSSILGGTFPYTYQWSNSATTAAITGVSGATYTLTVTDANGFTSVDSAVITEPAALATAITETNVSCNGVSDGTATVTVTGGTAAYTYTWSNAGTTASITGLAAGIYTVTVADANGCASSISTTITEPTVLGASSALVSNVDCNGSTTGQANATAIGGTNPYTYQWSNSAITASLMNAAAGTYSITITDANGCTDSSTVSITEPTVLTSSIDSSVNINCNGNDSGMAFVSAAGGVMPYTYLWSNNSVITTLQGVFAGTYSVTVTDANGCSSSQSVTLTEPATLVASVVVDSNVLCNGLAQGGATGSAIGGTAPYTYAWSNSATTASITSVAAGTYTVSVMDANGCTSNTNTAITESALITSSVNETACVTYTWPVSGQTYTTSGNYNSVQTAANGCDSVVTLNLTINSITTASVNMMACDSFTWPLNAVSYNATGTYVDTIPNSNGCDSIVTLNLTILNTTFGSTTVSSCDNYFWPQNAQTYTSTGNYLDTITNSNGCDSVVTLNLTILQSTSSTATITACDQFTWDVNNLTYSTSGNYFATIPNAAGCDSVLTLALTINESTAGTETISSCTNYTWPLNGQLYSFTGNYLDTIPNAAGCDSIVTLDLTILQPSAFDSTITSCGPVDYQGTSYSLDTTLVDTVPNSIGCDSIITVRIIVEIFDTTLSVNGKTLTANQSGIQYQWIRCNQNNQGLIGANSQSYTAIQTGFYAAVMTGSVCVDTTECLEVFFVGLDDITSADIIKVYPNPTSTRATIEFTGGQFTYELIDLTGKTIERGTAENQAVLNIEQQPAGVYMLSVRNETTTETIRLIKQ